MIIRNLRPDEAELLYNYGTDVALSDGSSLDFKYAKTADATNQIIVSDELSETLFRAIANDENECVGTVSLKHIDREAGDAEFAIAMRDSAMGKGYAWFGMASILDHAFSELGLNSVYWCVSAQNGRAIRFYEKHGFRRMVDIPPAVKARYSDAEGMLWYSVLAGDDYHNIALSRGTVAGCPVVSIKTVPTVGAGELSFFEAGRDIPFEVKRVYYISKVPEGTRRGFHAHRTLKQLLFCPYGEIRLILDDGHIREEITLNDPSVGVVIDKPIWREMLWLKKDSVLCVAASDYYDEGDYIRDYEQFRGVVNDSET